MVDQTKTAQDRPLYLRMHKAAELFGVHRTTLYRWAQTGEIRLLRKGSMTLLSVAELEAFIENRTAELQEVAV